MRGPDTDEARALTLADDYVVRAGVGASRRRGARANEDADWLATVSDSLLAGALLGAELINSSTGPRHA